MEDITRLTVHELVEKLNKNELSSEKIVKAYKARIEDKEKDVKAFITTTLDEAEKEAVKVDEERKSGAKSSFAGDSNWNKGQPMHEWSKNNMCI